MNYHLQSIARGAAGFYFLLQDNSEVASVPASSQMRLVFINTKKGPVNSLIYIQKGDKSGFKAIFGDIDRREERKGNFSVRTCLWALERGPILVCNLRKFDDELDKAGVIGLSTSLNKSNNIATTLPYRMLFNTERLWWSDPTQLLGHDEVSGQLTLANVGSQDVSIFIRKSKAKGFDTTIADWFKRLGKEVPSYMNPSDYVSDSMVDVFVFKTNFGDNIRNQGNENYGYLFDESGLKPEHEEGGRIYDTLDILSGIADAQYIARYTGSLIPGMVDSQGNSMQIQLALNGATNRTGILSMFDEDAAEDAGDNGKLAIDLVGHSIIELDGGKVKAWGAEKKTPSILGYNKSLKSGSSKISVKTKTVTAEDVENADRVDMEVFVPTTQKGDTFKFYNVDAVNIGVGDTVVGKDGRLKRVTKTTKLGDWKIIPGINTAKFPIMKNGELYPTNELGHYTYPMFPMSDRLVPVRPVSAANSEDAANETATFVVPNNTLKKGDHITYTGSSTVTVVSETTLANKIEPNTVLLVDSVDGENVTVKTKKVELVHQPGAELQFDSYDNRVIDMVTGTAHDLIEPSAAVKEKFQQRYNVVEVECEDVVLLQAPETEEVTEELIIGINVNKKVVTKINSLFDGNNYRLNAIVLPSYKLREEQFTNGMAQRQSEILDMMIQPNIVKGLKNSYLYRPRYIIDAFKTYIEPSYKYQYGVLAKELSEKSTMFSRAICNEAFVEDMQKSKNPYFRVSPDKPFNTEYVETGGNKRLPGSNTYEKPKDGDSYMFFFGPGVTVNHFGQTIIAPPAGLVSNAFIDKYTSAFPYSIVANTSGIIAGEGVSGVEVDFDQDDRASLERVGYNAIIRELGKGLMIYGNNTAQYRTKTSMSKIHASELVAFIQEQMLAITRDFVFKFNDYQNRLEVKKRADAVMNQILDNGGVLYFENKCDGSNNTLEIIENDMGVLDTTIVVGHGQEKFVHRTILERGGNISGFTVE